VVVVPDIQTADATVHLADNVMLPAGGGDPSLRVRAAQARLNGGYLSVSNRK
jgi:hypothetical protein